jgi:hypothetical protein
MFRNISVRARRRICLITRRWSDRVLASYYLRRFHSEIAVSVRGKDCFVLGSGPSPNISLFDPEMVVVSVNGSYANGKMLGLPQPVLTVVDYELLDPSVNIGKETRRVVVEERLLKGLHLGALVAVQSNSSRGGSPSSLQATYDRFLQIRKEHRRAIVHHVTGANLLENHVRGLTSTGAFCVALCAYGGARSVTFAGFSLFKSVHDEVEPHYYLEKGLDFRVSGNPQDIEMLGNEELDSRNHSLADCCLISQLVLNGHQIFTREKDFLPLIQNWGNNPPEWVR